MCGIKPSWQDAPKWANYLAQDSDGEWFWYENHPKQDDRYWMPNNGTFTSADTIVNNPKWRDSLEARGKSHPAIQPEQSEDIPF